MVWLGPLGLYGAKGTPSSVFVPMMAGCYRGQQSSKLEIWKGGGDVYNLCLLVFQGTLGVIREDDPLVRNRIEAQAGGRTACCIRRDEVLDFDGVNAAHTV